MSGILDEVMKRARPNQVDEATRKLLARITMACQPCHTFSATPQRFRLSLQPSDSVLNREGALELMWIEKKAVLHVFDIGTGFSSAMFLSYQTVRAVSDASVICWASL